MIMSGILIVGFLFVLRTNLYNTLDDGETRKDFEDFLRNHPYNQRVKLTPAEWKKQLPKKDRPDLALEHDFLMTMDPATKAVPKERLFEAYEYAEELRATMPVDREANWTEHGPNNVGGRSRAIMFDPTDATNKKFWAGSVSGGLWYTDDITASPPAWESVNGFWENIAITTMAYDPSNTDIFYVGTGEGWNNSDAVQGAGIFKTWDGGNSWELLPSTFSNDAFRYVQKIVVGSNGFVYAATRGYEWLSGGVYRSTDAGNNWTQVLTGSNEHPKAADIEIAADGTLYASLGIHYSDGLYKSVDNGDNWTKVNNGSNGFPDDGTITRIEIAIAPSDANKIYILGSGGDGSNDIMAILRSDDAGANWTSLAMPLNENNNHFTRGQSWYDLIMAVSPTDANTVYAGGIDLHKSTDGGFSWNMVSHWWGNDLPEVHADQHAMTFRPNDSQYMVYGNDGGIHLTEDGGSTFSHRNTGYNVTQFYSVAMHPTEGEFYFLAGSQDNGTQQFQNASGIVSTLQATGGDGAFCFIDQDNADYQITSYVYNQYYLSENGGSNFSTITSLSESGRFINPADYDNNANILYSAHNADSIFVVNVLQNGIDITTDFLTIPLGNTASHLRVSDFTDNTIFIGTGSGKVFKVINANNSTNAVATEITGLSFPNGYVSCIELGDSENQILVTFSNYGVSSVWETLDGGSTWAEKEGNLPDMPVRWAVYNPNNYNEVLLATELGVWSSIDFNAGTPSWSPSNTGLANVRTDMFQIRADNLVAAATHGRGLFTSDSFQRIPVASISTDTISVNINQGTTTQESFTISNTGEEGSVLNYQINFQFSGLTSDTIDTENFEAGSLPEGWTSSSNAVGWQFGTTSSSYFTPPDGDGNYAYVNDDAAGSDSDGSADYLTTPLLDFSTFSSPILKFSSFIPSNNYFQTGTVEASLNSTDWTSLGTAPTGDSWTNVEIDLSGYSGQQIYIRFHANDGGAYATGWAIDNILLEAFQPWASVNPTFGFIAYSETETFQVNFDAADLTSGVYNANMILNFNTGASDTIVITMNVGGLNVEEPVTVPGSFTLYQNYPNPFNPVTTFSYDLPEDALVNITIYDIMGQVVRTLVNIEQTAGFKSIQWNATNDAGQPVSAGPYLYTIQAGEHKSTKKMVLLK